jgi:flagellar M-ring protein FliF
MEAAMEFLRRYWTQIRAQLEQLSVAQKALIATLLVLLLLVGFLLLQYAGQPRTVPITQFSSSGGNQVLSRLRAAGIDAQRQGGQVVVPIDKRNEAIALLVQDNLLSKDAASAFDELVANQSPWSTEQQDRRSFLVAKNKVLSRILEKMQTVREANVVIDMPQDQGFGQTHVQPSASVSVTLAGGESINDERVAAIAGLVAGSVAEMSPQNVTIIDSNRGQQYTVNDPAEAQADELRELVRQEEQYFKKKLTNALQYIPDVIVAVTVQTSNVAQQSERSYQYSESEPLESERTSETTRRNLEQGGEPGARSNTGANIAGGGNSGGTVEQTEETETEFREKPLVQQTSKKYSGHQTQQINVAINVPRSYFVKLYKQQNPDAEGEPTNEDLQPLIQERLDTIQNTVQPLVQSEKEGQVQVAMYPDGSTPAPQAMTQAGGGTLAFLEPSWIKTALVAGLALLSLGMMFGMVRKATKKQELPSVEELAGAPPAVGGEEEVVGEAEEADGGMVGVELDENQLQSRKVAEQISEMIKNDPSEAGAILSRWVDPDE